MIIDINTIKEINFSEMFIETRDEIYSKIKNYTNCKIKKYKTQERYLTLLSLLKIHVIGHALIVMPRLINIIKILFQENI
jgi:hypothetical protein